MGCVFYDYVDITGEQQLECVCRCSVLRTVFLVSLFENAVKQENSERSFEVLNREEYATTERFLVETCIRSDECHFDWCDCGCVVVFEEGEANVERRKTRSG